MLCESCEIEDYIHLQDLLLSCSQVRFKCCCCPHTHLYAALLWD